MIKFISYIFSYPFMLFATLAIVGVSAISGTIGTYVTINRFSYIAGALSHSILFGLGFFNYLGSIFKENSPQIVKFFNPLNGAFLSAILFSLITGYLFNSKKERLDTILSAIWSIGMSLGVLFMFLTPGYNQELTRYLFGSILLVSIKDLIILFCFAFIIIIIFTLFYKKILSISFDNEFASLMGQNSKIFNLIVIFIISFAVVLLTQVVGIVLLIALLTLPSATVLKFNFSFKKTMFFSGILTLFAGFAGLIISFNYDLPPSPVIIIILGFAYILSLSIKNFQNKIKMKPYI